MNERNLLIGRLHAAKRRLGLHDTAYREMLQRITGKRSSALLNASELRAALEVIAPQPCQSGLSPHAKKVQALWISAWNLGLVRNNSDHAMRKFVKRQTGIDHQRWLIDARDAKRVVEALKEWMGRAGGVDWAACDRPERAVVEAQWRRLVALGHVQPFNSGRSESGDLQRYGYRLTGKDAFQFYDRDDFIRLQRALGRRLRGALARERERGERADVRRLH